MHRRNLFRLALGVCLAVVLIIPVFADGTAIKVDGTIIKGYIATMAAPEQLGRRTLTPGHEKAAEWAAAKFKEWGVRPAGENGTYFQSVPMPGPRSAFVWVTGVPSLSVAGRSFFVRENDFTVDVQSTPGTAVNAEVVFVGYGISAPAKGLDEYAGLDVKGKIVLALKGSPTTAPDPRPAMGGIPAPAGEAPKPATTDGWADESTDLKKATTASEKGALAILLYNPPTAPAGMFGAVGPAAAAPAEAMAAMMRQVPTESPFTKPFLFVSNISDSLFRAVMWRDPQESMRGFDARLSAIRSDIKVRKARSAKTAVLAQIKGYTTTKFYNEKAKNTVSRNVIGKVEGTDPVLKAQYVVMGGHMDHNGMTNGVIFNGADDNASGTATTMELARLLTINKVQPKRTIVFCLWTGEEQGLNGSSHYVEHPTDGVSIDKVVTYFNMDMVGLGDRIGAPGAMNFPTIYDVIARNQDPEILKLVDAETGGPGGSDQTAFIELGIEALALMTSGGTGHPDYHDAGDDVAKIDPVILGKTGQFVLQGALNVANETTVNLLIADRKTQYDAMRFTAPSVGVAIPGQGGWQFIRPSTQDELVAALGQRIKDLSAGTVQPTRGGMGRRGGGSARVATGVRSASLFGGSVALLEASVAALNFGRVDVSGPDGAWFGDKLTPAGKDALTSMEGANVALHLVRPSENLLTDVLDNAKKPILVTGAAELTPALVEKFKKNNALAVVECDPNDVSGCVRQIETMKGVAGKNSLLMSVGVGANRAAALKELYLAFAKAGWTKDEIYAMVGQGRGSMGSPAPNNLSRFSPAPAGRPF